MLCIICIFSQTVRFKNELERNITIKLGYANAKVILSNIISNVPIVFMFPGKIFCIIKRKGCFLLMDKFQHIFLFILGLQM